MFNRFKRKVKKPEIQQIFINKEYFFEEITTTAPWITIKYLIS